MQQNAPKFNCPQEGLYAVADLGCDMLTDNLSVFNKFSPSYDANFIDGLRTQTADASVMPGETNRAGKKRSMRVSLHKAKTSALKEWQHLKAYVEKAWPDPVMQKAKLSEAGSNLYRLATGGSDWAMVNKLMANGLLFITENDKALKENKNMPDDFVKTYQDKTDTFALMFKSYSGTGSTNEIQSNAKRLANNNVYEQVIQVCKAGQKIYKGESTMQKQFAFTQMLKKVGYGGTAGITFTLTYGKTKLAVVEADAVSTDLKYSGIGNAKGVLKINRMTEGEHKFTISALGFDELVVTVILQAGVKSRFEFTMIEEAKEVQNDMAKAA